MNAIQLLHVDAVSFDQINGMATLTPTIDEFSQKSWWSERVLEYQQSCGAFLVQVPEPLNSQLRKTFQAQAEGFQARSERIQVTALDGDEGVFKVERRATEVKILCGMCVLLW